MEKWDIDQIENGLSRKKQEELEELRELIKLSNNLKTVLAPGDKGQFGIAESRKKIQERMEELGKILVEELREIMIIHLTHTCFDAIFYPEESK